MKSVAPATVGSEATTIEESFPELKTIARFDDAGSVLTTSLRPVIGISAALTSAVMTMANIIKGVIRLIACMRFPPNDLSFPLAFVQSSNPNAPAIAGSTKEYASLHCSLELCKPLGVLSQHQLDAVYPHLSASHSFSALRRTRGDAEVGTDVSRRNPAPRIAKMNVPNSRHAVRNRKNEMSSRGCSLAVFAGVLVLATAGHALDPAVVGTSGETIVAARNQAETGAHGAAFIGPGGITSVADAGFEQPGEPAQDEAQARRESDWLAAPPDPARHNIWVPTAQWTVALTLTIPLFLIDPDAFNVAPISTDNFVDAWTKPPDWDDGDGIVANYVLHPIMGAEAYLMLRNREFGPIESFLFSTGVSVAWEYIFEAWVQQPSAVDLATTSPIGSLQGELRFQIRRRVARWSPSVGRDALLVLVDPVEALLRYINKEFLDRSSDAPVETVGSSLNVGPDQASVMIRLPF